MLVSNKTVQHEICIMYPTDAILLSMCKVFVAKQAKTVILALITITTTAKEKLKMYTASYVCCTIIRDSQGLF